jgi:hypothetical protein
MATIAFCSFGGLGGDGKAPVRDPWSESRQIDHHADSHGASEATRAQHDPRISVTPGSADWVDMGLDAVAMIEIPEDQRSGSHGSGALVDRCHVLTSRHVPFVDWEVLRQKAGIKVRLGYTGDSSTSWKFVTTGRTVLWGGGCSETFSKCEDATNVLHDWALIELDGCVDTIRPMKMGRPRPSQIIDQEVVALGFPNAGGGQGGEVTLMADDSCTVWDYEGSKGAVTTCAISDGQSGGPVVVRGNNGTWYFVGVNSGGNDTLTYSSYAPFIDPWDEIKAHLVSGTP